MTKYDDMCTKRRIHYSNQPHTFSEQNLNPAFISAYNNGDTFRVKVDFGDGDKPKWGYIGLTTGWQPCFLLMRTRYQMGSSNTINENCNILDSHWLRG
jgi:hypothetical protein